MPIIFAVVCLVIVILAAFIFIILKRTVKKVNRQTKSDFVNNLEEPDSIVKEDKIQETNKEIENKEKGINEEKNEVIYAFGPNSEQSQNEKNKENFVVNYEELIKDFLTLCNNSKNYDFCLNLRKKFDSNTIYNLKCLSLTDYELSLKKMLTDKEYKIYDAFKIVNEENTIENFVNYLDQLIDLNNPKIKILVGNKNENYNYLNENIETLVSDKIYRGIKIIYRTKVYDFSLSERNI